MQSLSSELRGVIENRLRAADQHEILAIASMLCAQDNQASAATCIRGPQQPATQRFVVQGNVVQDTTTGLMWTRKTIGKGLNWSAAKEACSKLREGGFEDWRLPTIQELLSLVDYSRTSPAIDTSAFECESNWYWSATPYSASPSDYAWYVAFRSGNSGYDSQGYVSYVRAVRSGQLIGSLV
jgi:Protein of unknown function (DUF1566)